MKTAIAALLVCLCAAPAQAAEPGLQPPPGALAPRAADEARQRQRDALAIEPNRGPQAETQRYVVMSVDLLQQIQELIEAQRREIERLSHARAAEGCI